MSSPDTSAQDAPRTTDYCDICGESPQSATHEGMPGGHAWTRRAASQEAEAREDLFNRLMGDAHMGSCPAHPDRVRNIGACTCGAESGVIARLDAYADAIRASERERYAALVSGLVQGIRMRCYLCWSTTTMPPERG